MITTELYKGQGLGNQLWCYVVTRVIAEDHGYKFGIMNPENFKGADFLDLDFGKQVIGGSGPEGGPARTLPQGINHYYQERKITHPNGMDIRIFDPHLTHVPDNTKIDGIMQDEQYITHRKDDIRKWLHVKKEYENLRYSKEHICVINFRGGEYVRFPNVFLAQKYWSDAIQYMRSINPDMEFVVVTDDKKTAQKFFPNFEISHDSIASDYSIIQNAYYLILSNSSFAFFPAWLNKKVKLVITPKYWAAHNISDGYWSCGYAITSGWHYLDREGFICDYNSCIKEFNQYIKNNNYYFQDRRDTTTIYALSSYSYRINMFTNLYQKISRKIPQGTKNDLKYFWNKITQTIHFFKNPLQDLRKHQLQKKWLTKEQIAEHRKGIKIYDVFTYNGEKDILDIRLHILYDKVDKFIIVEAPTTFSGIKKPLYFNEQKIHFEKFLDKIIYFVIDDYPNDIEICALADQSSNVPKNGPEHWRREFYQKESIKKALVNLDDEDICFIGDVDEIWNPDTNIDYTQNYIFKLRQKMYVYYLNNLSNEPWSGTIATKYKNIKNKCLNHIRTVGKTRYFYIDNGGWHFTNMGGLEEIRRKLNDSYTSESYNTTEVQNKLKERFGIRDYIGRKFKFSINENNLPNYLKQNKEKYIQLFKEKL